MTILVDMDDVLEMMAAGWVEYLNERYGTSVDVDEVTDWNIALAFPTLTHDQVYSAELDDCLWNYVRPMPGADGALRKLLADGHEIYIVTSTRYETLRTKMDKVLFRFFPYLDWSHVIITSCKHMVKGDILIDDGPHNFIGGEYRKILFTACHNRNFDEKTVGAVRVNGWDEAYAAVCRMAGLSADDETK